MNRGQQIDNSIILAAKEVKRLLDLEFAKHGNAVPPEFGLDHAGIEYGMELITEYIEHNERGIALEHLVYMITETDLDLPETAKKHIYSAAKAMEMDIAI